MLSIYFPLQHFRKPSLYAVLAWGNLTSDQDAGLTGMTYNALNLLSGYTHSADGDVTKITYTASGEKTDVFTEDNQIVASHWHRSGNLIYDGSFSSNRLLVDGGYVDISNAGYTYRFYIQDHQGNNRMVTDDGGTVLQVNHYDPYGQLLAPISSTSAVSEYRYGGKEWSDVTLSYDFGARNYLPSIPRWTTMDPLAEKYYSISPYVYCAGNPVNRIDLYGKWDIKVHLYSERSKYGYGIAVVTDNGGKELYRFIVRAQGVAGTERMNVGADTPLGVYDIPSSMPWIKGGNRFSYGPNHRLNMVGVSGEIVVSGRTNIRIHGGRQEVFSDGTWSPSPMPQLKRTYGCLRAYDTDMKTIKSLTDDLSKSNPNETPGQVIIIDDLKEIVIPASSGNMIEVSTEYAIPEDFIETIEKIRKEYYIDFIN